MSALSPRQMFLLDEACKPIREDWGYRYRVPGATLWTPVAEMSRETAQQIAHDIRRTTTPSEAQAVRRDRIVWTDGADYRGPWTVADQTTLTNPEAIA